MISGDRDAQRRRTLGELESEIRRRSFTCLYPDCDRSSVACHSQQKERQLRAIATDGIAYALNDNTYQYLYKDQDFMRKTGIQDASTFLGFCGRHDKELFGRAEIRPLQQHNREQSVVLFLRAVAYEIARKREAHLRLDLYTKRLAHSLPSSQLEWMRLWMEGQQLAFERDGPYYMTTALVAMESGKFDDFVVRWRTVPQNLGGSTCSVPNPMPLDEFYEKFYRTLGTIPTLYTFNIVPTTSKTHIILSWLASQHHHIGFTVPANDDWGGLEALTNELAFVESEDTCVSLDLWDNLASETQDQVRFAIGNEFFRGKLEVGQFPRVLVIG